MTFTRRLDRWVLATTLLGIAMFFLASEQTALGVIACGLIALGFYSNARRAPNGKGASGRGFVMLLNALTLGAVGYAALRVSGDRELLVESVGDLLAWALVIRVFDPRPGRRRGMLLLMSVFGTLAAVLSSNTLIVGLLLLVYTPVATWTIMLHQFAKGHEQGHQHDAPAPLVVPREALRRLKSLSLKLAPVAIVLAALVYVLMPRGVGADMLGEWQAPAEGATTGFTDRVMLQRSGELASSDEPVMDVVALDERGANVGSADRAVLLRGAALERYDAEVHAWVRNESWAYTATRGSSVTRTEITQARDDVPLTTYRITMRNKDTDYLFAPMRPVWVSLDRDTSLSIGVKDLVLRADRREGRMSYTIESAPEWAPAREGDEPLGPIEAPARVVERAREIIAQAELARDPTAKLTEDDGRIARVVEAYLRRNGVYETEMYVSPPGVDPIEQFVLTRMRGHCEQFASAMAAMLRGLGVSARVVTGYRAHEFNDIAGHYTVRQRDAHAWVEVRTGPGVWQSFDPSPSTSEAFNASQGNPLLRRARQVYEAIEHVWVVYVVSFDEQMKRALLERLGITLGNDEERTRRHPSEAWRPSSFGPRVLRAAGAGLIAFAATAGALYGVAGLMRLFGKRLRFPTIRWPNRRAPGRSRAAALMERRFARAMNALMRAGLERPGARGALAHAEIIGGVDAPLGETVRSLTTMHYAARFGGRALNEVEIARADALTRDIERLAREHARRTGKAGRRRA